MTSLLTTLAEIANEEAAKPTGVMGGAVGFVVALGLGQLVIMVGRAAGALLGAAPAVAKRRAERERKRERAKGPAVCGACSAKNADGAAFCKSCGAEMNRRVCPACDEPNDPDAKFCDACGEAFKQPQKAKPKVADG